MLRAPQISANKETMQCTALTQNHRSKSISFLYTVTCLRYFIIVTKNILRYTIVITILIPFIIIRLVTLPNWLHNERWERKTKWKEVDRSRWLTPEPQSAPNPNSRDPSQSKSCLKSEEEVAGAFGHKKEVVTYLLGKRTVFFFLKQVSEAVLWFSIFLMSYDQSL